MPDIIDYMDADAAKPKTTANGDVSSTNRDLREFIEADKYNREVTASEDPFAILEANTRQIVPPGAVE